MKITVFTSNQPRHLSLIKQLASIADEVFAVIECNTVFPGKVQDFYAKSELMQTYFEKVIAAEQEVFGEVGFLPSNVRTLSLKLADLNMLPLGSLQEAFSSDYYVVFGASYIKSPLVDELINRKAVNIHMGVSPYYRGSACNFWALYDQRPDLVGSTIHLLSKGLDSGPILFHAMPKREIVDPFVLGMTAVKAAHNGLVEHLKNGTLYDITPIMQDRTQELRYSRYTEFNDDVVAQYLNNLPSKEDVRKGFVQKQSLALFREVYY